MLRLGENRLAAVIDPGSVPVVFQRDLKDLAGKITIGSYHFVGGAPNDCVLMSRPEIHHRKLYGN